MLPKIFPLSTHPLTPQAPVPSVETRASSLLRTRLCHLMQEFTFTPKSVLDRAVASSLLKSV